MPEGSGHFRGPFFQAWPMIPGRGYLPASELPGGCTAAICCLLFREGPSGLKGVFVSCKNPSRTRPAPFGNALAVRPERSARAVGRAKPPENRMIPRLLPRRGITSVTCDHSFSACDHKNRFSPTYTPFAEKNCFLPASDGVQCPKRTDQSVRDQNDEYPRIPGQSIAPQLRCTGF